MHRPAYFSGGAYALPRKIKFGKKFEKNRFFNFNLDKKQLNQKLYFFITKKTVFLRNFNSRISILKKRISVFIKFVWAVHMHRRPDCITLSTVILKNHVQNESIEICVSPMDLYINISKAFMKISYSIYKIFFMSSAVGGAYAPPRQIL